jgi:hypothetical protein
LNSSNQRIAQFQNLCILKDARPREFGVDMDMDLRWNSIYVMLKHLLPYKEIFSTFIGANYGLVSGEPLLIVGHRVVAQKILEFLEVIYESTVPLFGVYYPTSRLVLHNIFEIASHLYAQETNALLMNIMTPMKLKILKYCQNIPFLYSFAFILDPRAKIRGFHNVLHILSQTIGFDSSNYYN